ncbi:hypothetical protein C8J57DRAFT_1721611 [Mycena rebaudengoi]|nr:hypothetical protein C8J57DRAFT_1721611 [Mycena rebaudengoi]
MLFDLYHHYVNGRVLLCTTDWAARNGPFDNENFFKQIVDLFRSDPEDEWAVETLAWLQINVFAGAEEESTSKSSSEDSGGDANAVIRAQRAARRAAAQSTTSSSSESSSYPTPLLYNAFFERIRTMITFKCRNQSFLYHSLREPLSKSSFKSKSFPNNALSLLPCRLPPTQTQFRHCHCISVSARTHPTLYFFLSLYL